MGVRHDPCYFTTVDPNIAINETIISENFYPDYCVDTTTPSRVVTFRGQASMIDSIRDASVSLNIYGDDELSYTIAKLRRTYTDEEIIEKIQFAFNLFDMEEDGEENN